MAKAPAKKGNDTKVTRITASEAAAPVAKLAKSKPAKSAKAPKAEKTANTTEKSPRKNPFVAFGRYFKGAWFELRQVRWPDRKNTWGMTGALLAFTLFFIVVILFLDFVFSELFKLILGSN